MCERSTSFPEPPSLLLLLFLLPALSPLSQPSQSPQCAGDAGPQYTPPPQLVQTTEKSSSHNLPTIRSRPYPPSSSRSSRWLSQDPPRNPPEFEFRSASSTFSARVEWSLGGLRTNLRTVVVHLSRTSHCPLALYPGFLARIPSVLSDALPPVRIGHFDFPFPFSIWLRG